MRLRATGLVAARELRESLRSRWFVAAAACFVFYLIRRRSRLGADGDE